MLLNPDKLLFCPLNSIKCSSIILATVVFKQCLGSSLFRKFLMLLKVDFLFLTHDSFPPIPAFSYLSFVSSYCNIKLSAMEYLLSFFGFLCLPSVSTCNCPILLSFAPLFYLQCQVLSHFYEGY